MVLPSPLNDIVFIEEAHPLSFCDRMDVVRERAAPDVKREINEDIGMFIFTMGWGWGVCCWM